METQRPPWAHGCAHPPKAGHGEPRWRVAELPSLLAGHRDSRANEAAQNEKEKPSLNWAFRFFEILKLSNNYFTQE
ncbi:hypothetical protein DOM22_16470 [Bdellovibrio sp. ZAP7]|nr:hypothetical protein DOM22_16470 [Bdellovibrio sp. ZAP7]